MAIDWNKPLEYRNWADAWIPAKVFHKDDRYTVVEILDNKYGRSHLTWYRNDEPSSRLRNVPEPKKKVWRAEISKPAPTKIIVSRGPLTKLANGELLGFQGWMVNKIEEVEV